jgi:hypothetical protein
MRCKKLLIRRNDPSTLQALFESNASIYMSDSDIGAILRNSSFVFEDILKMPQEPNAYPSLFTYAIHQNFTTYAKKLYESYIHELPNNNVDELLVVHKEMVFDLNYLRRLYEDVGFPPSVKLVYLFIVKPFLRSTLPLNSALIRCRHRKPDVDPEGFEKVLEPLEYVLTKFQNSVLAPESLAMAAIPGHRKTINLLLQSKVPITSEALHVAFALKDYELLDMLLDALATSNKANNKFSPPSSSTSTSIATPYPLEPISEEFRMPFPLKRSDRVFFSTLEKLVELGVYDISMWRRKVCYDTLSLNFGMEAGVLQDLFAIGKAEPSADILKRARDLSLSEFQILMNQPWSAEERERLSYTQLHMDLDRAKVLRNSSLKLRVPYSDVCELGMVWTYERNDAVHRNYLYFTQVLEWYLEDQSDCDDADEQEEASGVIRDVLLKYVEANSRLRGEEDIKGVDWASKVFRKLLDVGLQVTVEDISVAQEQGWDWLVELFTEARAMISQ